jgi:ABC-2 type transport system permease protein
MAARWLDLCENETTKLLRRRRPQLVLALLAAFLAISVWAQYRQWQNQRDSEGDQSWRAVAERRIHEAERRAGQRRIFVGFTRLHAFEAARLRYYLAHDINPNQQTGPLVSRAFAALGSTLLLPLLVTVLGADIVSSESRAGTIKMLLTRPVPRWRVLLSKMAVMSLFATLLVAAAALLSWLIAGFAFGWRGWTAPALTGFRFGVDGLDLSRVREAPLWSDALAAWGLAWFSAQVVSLIATTCSVLFRSTAAAMGTLLALLAAGTLLGQMATDWELARWLFVTNLPLPQFYGGAPPPWPGMTLGHAVAVLTGWAVGSAWLGLWVFSRRDVTA